jgi:hypothetical protein
MQIFVKAVVTGFGMALGAALFRKVAKQLGFEDVAAVPPPKDPPEGGEPLPA